MAEQHTNPEISTIKLLFLVGLHQNQPSSSQAALADMPDTSSLKNLRSFSNVHWFIMKTVCGAWTHSQHKPSNMEMCGMTRVRGADVGHPSGKERNKFRGIMVKTTAVRFFMGPDANFKHMSQEVRHERKGRTQKKKKKNTNVARLQFETLH